MKFTNVEIDYITDYVQFCSDPEDLHVYEDYSGRGMLRNPTDGLVVSNFMEIVKLVRHICEDRDNIEDIDVEDFLDKVTSLNRIDNLGYDTILY